ncbi:hypothetical protein UFOVP106_47 [uncultured Caudovirales phage]|uniref:Uncharacterized protein n=1 Tax=uncultured Caudovirales phage TaxID=2100421 RepID=A0A6J5L6N1_9CAUD|nr:hypothetical protein UFOVP106_47 [uncultured Caudovirales phage]
MANTSVYRIAGPTTAIAVTTSSSTAVTITPKGNDQINYCGFLNTSTNVIAVNIAPTSAGAAVLPSAGSTSTSFVLGVSMSTPMVVAVPPDSFSVTTIGSTSSTLYVMPMSDQT